MIIETQKNISLIKQPSAWIPIAMSLLALLMLLGNLALYGVVHEADEGVAAHLFQIWLVLEVLLVLFFAVKWLPINPKQALFVLAVQIIAVLIVCSPVFYFQL